jgi:hypothetical protein
VYPGNTTNATIPHKEVIDAADALLSQVGIVPEVVLYKTNMDAEVVRAVYHINTGKDTDIEMMFAWVNSYDKSKRFQTCVGARVTASGGYWIGGNMGSYTRKHTGNAKQEAIDAMAQQISNAGKYFNTLISHKEEMKTVILPEKLRAELLGRILFEKGFINLEQASIIKTEIMQPKDYHSDKNSLWSLLNHINLSLNKSHPRDWMKKCIEISQFFNKEFSIGVTAGDPNQISLLDVIEEVSVSQEIIENNTPEVPPEPEINFDL